MELETEEQMMFKGGVEILNRMLEAVRNWLDIGFLSVIKAMPVFSREAASQRGRLRSLYGTNWSEYGGKEEGKYVMVAGVRLKIAGEVDDSDRLLAGNWSEKNGAQEE